MGAVSVVSLNCVHSRSHLWMSNLVSCPPIFTAAHHARCWRSDYPAYTAVSPREAELALVNISVYLEHQDELLDGKRVPAYVESMPASNWTQRTRDSRKIFCAESSVTQVECLAHAGGPELSMEMVLTSPAGPFRGVPYTLLLHRREQAVVPEPRCTASKMMGGRSHDYKHVSEFKDIFDAQLVGCPTVLRKVVKDAVKTEAAARARRV